MNMDLPPNEGAPAGIWPEQLLPMPIQGNIEWNSAPPMPQFPPNKRFRPEEAVNQPGSLIPPPIPLAPNRMRPEMNRDEPVKSQWVEGIGKVGIYHRTRMCVRFQSGNCPNLTNCSYAHRPEELRRPGEALEEALALQGKGPLPDGEKKTEMFPSSDRSSAPCKRFQNTGFCAYGDRCHFSHGESGNFGGPRNNINQFPGQIPNQFQNPNQFQLPGQNQAFNSNQIPIPNSDTIQNHNLSTYPPPELQKHSSADIKNVPPPALSSATSQKKPAPEKQSQELAAPEDGFPPNWKGPRGGINTIYGDWIEDFEWEAVLFDIPTKKEKRMLSS